MSLARPLLLAWTLTIAIAGADFASGAGIKPAILYVVPVALSAWHSRRAGIVAALLAVLFWSSLDVVLGREVTSVLALSTNSLIRLAVFVLVAVLATGYRERLTQSMLLARTDPLTGLPNRRAFIERAEVEVAHALRFREPLSLAYIDVDDFKRVNDEHGHEEGDRVLALIGETLKARVRATDLPGRLGGDELAVLLPVTGSSSARGVMNVLEAQIAGALSRLAFPVRVSVGLAAFDSPPLSVAELLQAADEAMYAVKKSHHSGG